MGSYLWLWHSAQPAVSPIQTSMLVFTRSFTASTRNSSSSVPPSVLVMVFRWNAVARRVSTVASGIRSPASCWRVNSSKGRFRSYASITQSR